MLATASRYSHIEQYDGRGFSWASRDGIGVGRYEVRLDGLAMVLRVRDSVPFSIAGARRYWTAVEGVKYDWRGLAVSRFPALQGGAHEDDKLFCSEAATRALRVATADKLGLRIPLTDGKRIKATLTAMGYDPFNGENADAIFPGMFPRCALLKEVTS